MGLWYSRRPLKDSKVSARPEKAFKSISHGVGTLARSGRREGYPSRPPTPPCVRFRTRRFKCSAADPGVESESSGVPTPQASDCSRPHACARPPRSTRRSPGGGGLARTRSLESFQGCSQVLSPQHLLQQRLGLWSDRVRARRCRLTGIVKVNRLEPGRKAS